MGGDARAVPVDGTSGVGSRDAPGTPGAARGARLTFAATIAAQLVGLLVYWRGWDHHVLIGYGADLAALLSATVFGLTAAAVGLVILTSRPGNRIGRLLALTALGDALIVLAMFAAAAGIARDIEPTSTVAGWLGGSLLQPWAAGMLALIMVVFPTGQLISVRWRWAVVATFAGASLRFIETAFGAGPVYYFPTVENPFVAAGLLGELLAVSREYSLGLWALFVGFVLGAGSLFVRFRVARRDERRQIAWFVVAGGAAILAALPLMYAFLFIDPGLGRGEEFWVGYFLVSTLHPIAVGIAITRYRLYEIDRIVNRAIVYGGLTAILAGLFAASISLSQRLFVAFTGESSDAAIVLTTLVVTTAYTPVRKRLEALVDRRFKFEIDRFGAFRSQLERTLEVAEPAAATGRLLREAVTELGATGAAVVLTRGGRSEIAATAGAWDAAREIVRVEIGPRGAGIGHLALGPARAAEGYGERELEALRSVAELLGRSLRLHGSGGPARR